MPASDSLRLITPEIIVLITVLIALTADLWGGEKGRALVPAIGIIGLGIAIYPLLMWAWPQSETIFSGAYTVDPCAAFFKILAALVGIFVILISRPYVDKYIHHSRSEFYALTLFAVLAIMIAASSTDLLMIFLAIEFLSLTSYLAAGYMKSDRFSAEASVKYLLYGLVASGIMLYGMSLLYGMTGTLNLYDMTERLRHTEWGVNLMTLIFLIAGFGFKIALVPFHMWAPDVYEGAPTPMTAFFSVGPKIAGFAVLMRTLFLAYPSLAFDWIALLEIIAVVTMIAGNVLAISQNNLKRLLAYSSIAHAGTILIGVVAVVSGQGVASVMAYLFIYSFMNLGAFAVVIAVGNITGSVTIDHLKGLSQNYPFLTFALTVFLLSLAGIPPMGGFIAKFLVFGAAIESGHVLLAIVGIVNSVIAAYYYLNIVRVMVMVPAPEKRPVAVSRGLTAAIAGLVIIVFVTGLYPAPLLEWVAAAHLLVPL